TARTAPAAPAVVASPVPPAKAELLGLPVALTDYERTLDWIDATVASEGRGYICVAAVHTVMASAEDPELREAVLASSMTVPDGQPLVWALNALGHPLPDRVYGPTLMAKACERAATTGQRIFLYGGRNEGALVQLTLNLRRRYPGIRIVGGYSPPFRPLSSDEEDRVVEMIDGAGADVVWVGIGVPKQEKWMYAMRDKLRAPVLVGVGAAFDFHAELIPQAPAVLQRFGLEWAFRLAQEPGRLWKRYAKYNPLFVLGFIRQYAGQRFARASR
ncbi:MAG: WecB/TagA/CpsF family glycosyltransferase, partial [Solirubrobacteraceae bacterium]|nr:WecB/TagA/CpsF family glycosyltransferase [Solirubrobacteraceae bacterium]